MKKLVAFFFCLMITHYMHTMDDEAAGDATEATQRSAYEMQQLKSAFTGPGSDVSLAFLLEEKRVTPDVAFNAGAATLQQATGGQAQKGKVSTILTKLKKQDETPAYLAAWLAALQKGIVQPQADGSLTLKADEIEEIVLRHCAGGVLPEDRFSAALAELMASGRIDGIVSDTPYSDPNSAAVSFVEALDQTFQKGLIERQVRLHVQPLAAHFKKHETPQHPSALRLIASGAVLGGLTVYGAQQAYQYLLTMVGKLAR